MQTLAQTREMDHLGQEVHELREEVTTLRAKVEKLTNLVSSLMATRDQPSCPQQASKTGSSAAYCSKSSSESIAVWSDSGKIRRVVSHTA